MAITDARQYHHDLVHFLRADVAYTDDDVAVSLGWLPANATVIDAGMAVSTAFNAGTSNVLDLGFRNAGDGTADDTDEFATDSRLAPSALSRLMSWQLRLCTSPKAPKSWPPRPSPGRLQRRALAWRLSRTSSTTRKETRDAEERQADQGNPGRQRRKRQGRLQVRRRQIIQARAAERSPVATPSLAELYERKYGKPPHHRMKPETIARKIKDADCQSDSR